MTNLMRYEFDALTLSLMDVRPIIQPALRLLAF